VPAVRSSVNTTPPRPNPRGIARGSDGVPEPGGRAVPGSHARAAPPHEVQLQARQAPHPRRSVRVPPLLRSSFSCPCPGQDLAADWSRADSRSASPFYFKSRFVAALHVRSLKFSLPTPAEECSSRSLVREAVAIVWNRPQLRKMGQSRIY
jgi:hypothetical protein